MARRSPDKRKTKVRFFPLPHGVVLSKMKTQLLMNKEDVGVVPLSYFDTSKSPIWHWDFICDKRRFLMFNLCKDFRG